MRINNVKPDEFLSPLLGDEAEKIANFLIARFTNGGTHAQAARYKRVCDLARHKYPYRGPMPGWVFAGHLD